MSTEQNKIQARRFLEEVINGGQVGKISTRTQRTFGVCFEVGRNGRASRS